MSSLSLERLKREFRCVIDEEVIDDVLHTCGTEDAARKCLESMVPNAERAQSCPPQKSDDQSLQEIGLQWLMNSDRAASEMTTEDTDILFMDDTSEGDPTDRLSEEGSTRNAISSEGDETLTEDIGLECDPFDRPSEDSGTSITITKGDSTSLVQEDTGLGTDSNVNPFGMPGDQLNMPCYQMGYSSFHLGYFSSVYQSNVHQTLYPGGKEESSLKESTNHNGTAEKMNSLAPSSEMKLSPEAGLASCSAPEHGSERTDALLVPGATVTETTSTLGVSFNRTSDFLYQSAPSCLEVGSPNSDVFWPETVGSLASGSSAVDDWSSKCSEGLSRKDSLASSSSSVGLSQGLQSSSSSPAPEPGAVGDTGDKPRAAKYKLSANAPVFVPRQQLSSSSTDGSCPDLYGINTASNSTRSSHGSGRSISLSPPNTSRHHSEEDRSHEWSADRSVWGSEKTATLFSDQDRGATVPAAKPKRKPVKKIDFFKMYASDIQEISSLVENGHYVMVLMRGVPGSGKSTMAGCMKGNGKVYSTDDFFLDEECIYRFSVSRLPAAHQWNQEEVERGLRRCINPVIVDNTNIEMWEMEPYARMAVKAGYRILIKEPEGVRERAEVLCRRNTHGVPWDTIRNKQQLYRPVSVAQLLDFIGGNSLRGNGRRDGGKRSGTTSCVQGKGLMWEDSPAVEPKPRRLRTISRDRPHAGEDGVRRRGDGWEDASPKLQDSVGERDIDIRDSFKNPSPLITSPQKTQKSTSSPARRPRKLPPAKPGTDWKNLYPMPAPAPLPPRPQPSPSPGAGSLRKSGHMVDAQTMVEPADYLVEKEDESLGFRVMTGRVRGSISGDLAAPEVMEIKMYNNHRDNSTMTTDVSEMEYLYEVLRLLKPGSSRDDIEKYILSCKDSVELVSNVKNLYGDENSSIDDENDDDEEEEEAPASQGAKSVSLLNQSMQTVLQRGAVNENAMIRNLQEGCEKREETILQFHRQHSNPHAEETGASGAAAAAAARVEAGPRCCYPPAGASSATRQHRPKPLPPAPDTRTSSEGAFVSLPMSLFNQLKEAFGDSTGHGESTAADDKEVYVWIDRTMGQLLLKKIEKGVKENLFAESLSLEEMKQKQAQLKEDELLARRLQEEEQADQRVAQKKKVALGGRWNQPAKQVVSLLDIIEEQVKATEAETRQNMEVQRKKAANETIATMTAHNHLYKSFPSVGKELLDSYMDRHEYSFHKASEAIQRDFNIQPQRLPLISGTERFETVTSLRKEFEDARMTEKWALTDADFRLLTSRVRELQQKRNECAAQSIVFHQKKMGQVSLYYVAEAVRLQREITKEVKRVFYYKVKLCEKKVEEQNVLDLHGFNKDEAVLATQCVLKSRERAYHTFGARIAHANLTIVTGRGKHSKNGAQIRPAIINLLTTKNYSYVELNPGALCVSFSRRPLS